MDTEKLKKAERLGIRLMKAAEGLANDHLLFKEHGLSVPQYNVMRILRGAGPEGLRCQEISDRMVKRVPDITRLLDRLVDKDLVARERSQEDRRVVISTITPRGLGLLQDIDDPLRKLVEAHFRHFTGADLDRMNALLEKLERGLNDENDNRKDG